MLTNKLEKKVILYKAQFDKFSHHIFGGYLLDRLSLELDGLSFKIKYMIKNNKDVDKISEIKKEFSNKALELRSIFGEFLHSFLCEIIEIPENCHLEDIIDVLAQDVEIDSLYVKFKMIIISNNIEYLEFINNSINSDSVFDMFPGEYFRFTTDSYNDAIAKAYPELFENKHQDQIGVGADGDVFCHSFTFQTSEACNLQCTYCFAKGTKILMADKSYKNIENIKIGDMVYGFKEYLRFGENRKLIPTEVTHTFKRSANNILKLSHNEIVDTYVTYNHPFITANNRWIEISKITKSDGLTIEKRCGDDFIFDFIYGQETEFIDDEMEVYNFETNLSTYVANDMLVHNCYQFAKTPMRMNFETAKKFIDKLLADEYGYINRYNSPAIIIEFIGGEPFLEITLTRKIYEYFLDRCYELNHPWFYLHRVSICSNGLLYFEDEVQSFFKDYSQNISFNISIDGNKELHDSCRIQPNEEGSYNICMTALNHYNKTYSKERNSKMTLAPSNMKYLFDSVVDFIKNDMKVINMNCVFEEGWNQITAKEEYYQLKKLADYLIDNNMENIYIAIFNERQEDMQPRENDGNFCFNKDACILTPNGSKRIVDLKVGDLVYTGSWSINKVTEIKKYKSKKNNRIVWVEGGVPIYCTADHRFLSKKYDSGEIGFHKLSDLVPGDNIGIPCPELMLRNIDTSILIDKYTAILLGIISAGMMVDFEDDGVHLTNYHAKNRLIYNLFNESKISYDIIESGEEIDYIRINYCKDNCISEINDKLVEILSSDHSSGWYYKVPTIIWNSPLYTIQDFIYGFIVGSYNSELEYNNDSYIGEYNIHFGPVVDVLIDIMILLRLNNIISYYSNDNECVEGDNYYCLAEDHILHFNTIIDPEYPPATLESRSEEDEKTGVLWLYIDMIKVDHDIEGHDVYCPTVMPINDTDPEEHTIIVNGVIAKNCGGGSASMLSLRPNGEFYPCIRYMPTSIGNLPEVCIGDVDNGLLGREDGSNIIKDLDENTRRAQNNDICYECPISNDCGSCSALGYTIFGSLKKRTNFICIQMIAEALVNVYYWNRLLLAHPEYNLPVRKNNVPDEWSKLVIDDDELSELRLLEATAMLKKIEK